MNFETFIGLEIHIQLLTESKVFCSCKSSFGDAPNTNVCPVCLGYPGVLPVANKKAIKFAYIVCKALNCELSQYGVFERKNYFYPDLPKNYQISQYENPFGKNGNVSFEIDGEIKTIGIHDVHLEEDAGKMIHQGDHSFLDYNRAGTSLLEIVTNPDFKTGEEAEAFLQSFRRLVRYLGVCDGNMEEGSLRCDANISINEEGKGLGRKVEIKNLNSSRYVKKALQFEENRQKRLFMQGQTIVQETRLWNEQKNMTESMRSKEEALDYRYFPEPDMPPFIPDSEFLDEVNKAMVELPLNRRQRLKESYSLSDDVLDFLIDEKSRADFFEEAVSRQIDPSQAATWLKGDVAKVLNRDNLVLGQCSLTVERFADLMKKLEDGSIHGKIAKQVLEVVFEEDKDVAQIISEKGWDAITDDSALEKIVQKVLDDNPKAVSQIRDGDQKPRGFLVGQVMQATKGSANPQSVQKLLSKLLG